MSTMTKPVSFRLTEQQWDMLQESADESGCHSVSEYIRRKVTEDPRENAFHHIQWGKEYSLSVLAHINVMMEFMFSDDEKRQKLFDKLSDRGARQEMIAQYKMAFKKIENGED